MGEVDALWQNFIEQEKLRLMDLPAEELFALDFFTDQCVDHPKEVTSYGLWHETPEFRNSKVHSFILKATRKLFLCFYRNYLAGFALNESGTVLPISDDVLYSYD